MELVSYLFSPIPGSAFNYYWAIVIYAAVLIAVAVGIKAILIAKKNNKALKKTYKSTPGQFIWTGIIILLLAASRANGIPYLSMRFLLILGLLLSVYYIVKNILNYFKKYPEMKKVVAPKRNKKEERPSYSTHKKKS